MYTKFVKGILILADVYATEMNVHSEKVKAADALAEKYLNSDQFQTAIFALIKHRGPWLNYIRSMKRGDFERNAFKDAMNTIRENLEKHLADHTSCCAIKWYCFYSNVMKVAFVAEYLKHLNLQNQQILHDIAMRTVYDMLYDYDALQMCSSTPDFPLSLYRGK